MVEVLCSICKRGEGLVDILCTLTCNIPGGNRKGEVVNIFCPVTELCNVCNVLFYGIYSYVFSFLVLAHLNTGTEAGPVNFAPGFLDGVVLFVASPEDKPGGSELKSSSYKIFRNFYDIGLFVNFTAIFLEDLPCLGVRDLNTRVHQNFHGGIVNCFEFISGKKV